jgi:hypothetical protein
MQSSPMSYILYIPVHQLLIAVMYTPFASAQRPRESPENPCWIRSIFYVKLVL